MKKNKNSKTSSDMRSVPDLNISWSNYTMKFVLFHLKIHQKTVSSRLYAKLTVLPRPITKLEEK